MSVTRRLIGSLHVLLNVSSGRDYNDDAVVAIAVIVAVAMIAVEVQIEARDSFWTLSTETVATQGIYRNKSGR